MLQKPAQGNAKAKRKQWSRKRIVGRELHYSIKAQKHEFQKHLRNGKYVDLPVKGSSYKRVVNRDAKYALVS